MKTIKILILFSVTAAIATSAYQLISSDEENILAKPIEEITSQSKIQNSHFIHGEENKSAYLASTQNKNDTATLHIENKTQQEDTQGEVRGYSRPAPPPPLTANQSRDARDNVTQGHGHEHAPVSRARKVNEPAPPSGENN